mmetsp:Transcript_2978/g.5508  ORF Transcript_2978/g.5508 Transcript_2978/m.5508 type:complete len:135 (-) Transcript_2978:92-496(-)
MCKCTCQSLLWWICGGAVIACFWWIFGWLCCCCPCGDDLRKIGSVAWNPYTKNVDVGICGEDGGCDGICDCGYNLIWMITFGWLFFLFGCLLAILTLPLMLCGLRFSEKHWTLAKLGLMPMGANVSKKLDQSEQ